MNTLKGHIVAIDSSEGLQLVKVEVNQTRFTSLIIEDTHAPFVVGEAVYVLFKETEVFLATSDSRVSAQNAVIGTISAIEEGVLLSHVTFGFNEGSVGAIITKESAKALGCKVGERLMWCVKSNETTLQKVQ